MKPFRAVLALTVCLFVTAHTDAFEKRSYRIKSMGQYLAGIVEDRYTDLLANPARAAVTPSQMNINIASYASPLSLGYVSGSGWAAIGEWDRTHSQSTTDSNTMTFANESPRQITTYSYNYMNKTDYPALKLMKAVNLFGRRMGIGLEYQGTYSAYQYRREQDSFIYNTAGQETYISQSHSNTDTTSSGSSFNVEIGNHTETAEQERDFVIGFAPSFINASELSYNLTFTDNDPDGNSLNSSGGWIPWTPYFTLSESYAAATSDPHINVQASCEYRSRRRETKTDSHAVIYGAYYRTSESSLRGTARTYSNTTNGATVTIASATVPTTNCTKSDSAEAYATLGRSIVLPGKKILLAYAAGLDLSVTRNLATITNAALRVSDTDTLTFSGKLFSSAGLEYTPIKQIAIMAGVSPEITMSQSEKKVVNYDNILNNKVNYDAYDQTVLFSAGLSLRLTDPLRIDAYSTADLTWVSTYSLQLQYVF